MAKLRLPAKPPLAVGSITRTPNPFVADAAIARGCWKRRYHFPGAVRLSDGTILVAARCGIEHVDHRGRIEVFRSTDDGRTWSRRRRVWDSRGDDRDPKLSVLASGRILLTFFTRADAKSPKGVDSGVFVLRSDDGGHTWQGPTKVETSHPGQLASHGAATAMPDGTILVPVYSSQGSGTVRSRDDGLTFPAESEQWFDCDGVGTNEVTLHVMRDGLVLAWVRLGDEREGSLIFRSTDSGHTWTGPEHSPIAQSSADMLELGDGSLLLAWGDLSHRFGARRVTCAAIVEHPAEPWRPTHAAPVWDAFNFDQGNPSLVSLPDGGVLMVVNDYASRQLVAKRLSPDDLRRAPDDALQHAGAIDLLALVDAGAASVRTNLAATWHDPPVAGPLGPLHPGLGLSNAAVGEAGQDAEGHYTILLAKPLVISEVGVALRPGEDQEAWVGVADLEGIWRRVGHLLHGWRMGDVDWFGLGAPGAVTGIRVTTRANTAKLPPKSREVPPVAITRIAVR